MNIRKLTLLALAALLAGGLALWTLDSRAPRQDVGAQGLLLPGLAARINDIEQVRLVGAGGDAFATLVRVGEGWALQERGGYPADPSRLRSLLLALSEAQRVEAKTANPALHARLGVEDVEDAQAHGVRVEISGGGPPVRVILGENAAREAGTYVRLADEPQAWLIDRNIAVEKRPAEWLQRELANLPTARIASVTVQPPTGAEVRIGRPDGANGDLQLLDLPRGREPASEYIAESTAGLLDSLRFEDVLADADAAEPADAARVTRFRSVEGLEVELRSWIEGERTLARFAVRLDEAAASAWAAEASAPAGATGEAPEGEQETAGSASAVSAEGEGDRLDALRDETAAMQRRFADRVFVLPAFKAGNLNRDLEAYLKPAS